MKNGTLLLKNIDKKTILWLKITYASFDEDEKNYVLKNAFQSISFALFSFEENSFGTYRLSFSKEYLTEHKLGSE